MGDSKFVTRLALASREWNNLYVDVVADDNTFYFDVFADLSSDDGESELVWITDFRAPFRDDLDECLLVEWLHAYAEDFLKQQGHAIDFFIWSRKSHVVLYAKLSDVVPTLRNINVGDEVYFVNDYGVTFGPRKILGFCRPEGNRGRCVYWDTDAYWFPAKPSQIFTPAEYDDFCNSR